MDTEHDERVQRATRSPRIMRLLESNARVAWQVVGILIAIGLLSFVFSRIKLILLAVFVALVVAAIVEPLSARLERRGLGRRMSTSIGLVFVLVLVGGAATVVAYRLVDQLPHVAEDLQARQQDLMHALSQEPLSLSEDEVDELLERGMAVVNPRMGGSAPTDPTTEALTDETPEDTTDLESPGGSPDADSEQQRTAEEPSADDGRGPSPNTTFRLLLVSASGLTILGYMLVGVVLSFFLVRDRDRITDGVVLHLAGGDHDHDARRVLRVAWEALDGYVRASVIIGALEATAIGLALVAVGTPLAGALAFITFAGAFVPVVGATVAGLLAVGLTWLAVGTPEAVIIAVVVLVVQQFDGHVLQPTIVAANTHLHPIATILALLVGGLVGGLLGALLAVPTTAVVVAVANELLSPTPAGASRGP